MGNCVLKQEKGGEGGGIKKSKSGFISKRTTKRRKKKEGEHGPSGGDDFNVKSTKSKEFQKKKLEKLFEQYKAHQDQENANEVYNSTNSNDSNSNELNNKEYITQEGLGQFCKDLGIDEDDSVLFILAYLFKIEDISLGFSKEEFINGFEKYKLDTLDKIRSYLPEFRKELEDFKSESFKDIHRWGFDFAKTEKEHRIVDKESVIVMLALIWQNKNWHITKFVEYLKCLDSETSVKALNLDQWMSLYDFCISTDPDLSNFDQNAAWPCIIDDYVEWIRSSGESLKQQESPKIVDY
eukprot:TRINITY_DN1709_c0_g1_i1.p1 TRINITY_DN1709_c0_g1~~TRINITY_DN1709_c0_g1_i1.p1  ORF type:complete len:295 (+),score=90.95 TRINITY_DN1709_c0_g1_i1:209-1093(+)